MPLTWRASSTAAQEPQLPQWSSHTASQWNSSWASGSSSQFDLPIRSSSPPAPPAGKTDRQLIKEFVSQFVRAFFLGAENEAIREALSELKRRLVRKSCGLLGIRFLPESFFIECGLPSFVMPQLQRVLKTFLKEEVQLAAFEDGEFEVTEPDFGKFSLLYLFSTADCIYIRYAWQR